MVEMARGECHVEKILLEAGFFNMYLESVRAGGNKAVFDPESPGIDCRGFVSDLVFPKVLKDYKGVKHRTLELRTEVQDLDSLGVPGPYWQVRLLGEENSEICDCLEKWNQLDVGLLQYTSSSNEAWQQQAYELHLKILEDIVRRYNKREKIPKRFFHRCILRTK